MVTEFLNSINQTKENLINKDYKVEKDYVPFVINKCLSYFTDTVFYANRMNQSPGIDKKLQYDYYLHSISKRKRFSKWIKPEKNEDVEIIKQVYGYSDTRAREVVDLVPVDKIRHLVQKGGQKQ